MARNQNLLRDDGVKPKPPSAPRGGLRRRTRGRLGALVRGPSPQGVEGVQGGIGLRQDSCFAYFFPLTGRCWYSETGVGTAAVGTEKEVLAQC